jgi:hypothetical protein
MPTTDTTTPWEQSADTTQRWPGRPAPQPPASAELEAEVERAKQVINTTDPSDEERGELYTEATLDRASSFLKMHADHLLRVYKLQLPIPHIGVGPNGSIDLHWKSATSELLVNIPADANALVTYYGDDYGEQKVKGSMNLKTFNFGIAACLMN